MKFLITFTAVLGSLANIASAAAAPISNKLATRAPDGIKGPNVAYVEHSSGAIVQSGDKTWVDKTNWEVHTWEETHRDEWSVYAKDTSRNMRLQIDIWRNKIRYQDLAAGGKMTDKYDIWEDSPATEAPVKGWTMKEVGHVAGGFKRVDDTTWTGSNKIFLCASDLVEEGRDEWSVYLNNKVTSYWVQIDLYRNKVTMGPEYNDFTDVYDVNTFS